jgi:PAS domain S-box-containing protein
MTEEGADPHVATEQEMASVVASSLDAVLGMTPSGTITTCNPAAACLYGYLPAELVGSAAEMLVPRGLRGYEAAILARIVGGGEVEPYRADRLRQDGTEVSVSVTVSPILDADSRIVGVSTVARPAGDAQDAGDRLRVRVSRQRANVRDAEDRFRAGLEADRARERLQVGKSQRRFEAAMDVERAKERVHVQDAEDRFQQRMEAERAKERVHVQEAEDRFQVGLEGNRARERIEVENAEDRFQVGLEGNRARARIEVENAEDRFQIGIDADRARERADVQNAEDRFQTELDVERAEAQSDRARLESQLQQGQRLEILGQLAGGVAHDFNNLLAVILNYAAFVTDELGTGPGANVAAAALDVAQIERAAERAAALTHQLLAFARREVVRPRVLDLNTVVADVEELLRRTIGADVLLSTELAPDIRPVLMDPGQVEQVLMNVAVNARDAMTRGGTLRIETTNIDVDVDFEAPASPYVRLRISDTGRGMSAEVLDRAFEPFYTTKPEGMGTGLGLATVYGIVSQAGGSVTARSRLGVGTTLTILLPATEEIAVPVVEAPAVRHRGNGETVLVVEDEDALRAVTERILIGHGYQVLVAADGVEAVALAGSHDGEISLLVTDVVMPKMAGNEVADRIRAARPGTEVLFMSGYARNDLASRSLLDGDVHLIEKPFTAEALLQRAGQILDRDRTTPAGGSPRTPATGPAAAGPGPNRDRSGPDAAQTRTATSG